MNRTKVVNLLKEIKRIEIGLELIIIKEPIIVPKTLLDYLYDKTCIIKVTDIEEQIKLLKKNRIELAKELGVILEMDGIKIDKTR